jgi:prepilin signal peptidase PulO-like enzyme (type II secretory pathway)
VEIQNLLLHLSGTKKHDSMAWFEIVLIVTAGLFVFSTIGSLFFGDVDIDAGMDIDGGFIVSDVISFKGLIHFALGLSLALTLWQEVNWMSMSVGVITGIIFVAVLYCLYKVVYEKLQQNMQYTHEIKEMDAEVYYWSAEQKVGEVFVTLEGRPVTITLQCAEDIRFEKGQKIKVSGTRKVVYPINI